MTYVYEAICRIAMYVMVVTGAHELAHGWFGLFDGTGPSQFLCGVLCVFVLVCCSVALSELTRRDRLDPYIEPPIRRETVTTCD